MKHAAAGVLPVLRVVQRDSRNLDWAGFAVQRDGAVQIQADEPRPQLPLPSFGDAVQPPADFSRQFLKADQSRRIHVFPPLLQYNTKENACRRSLLFK